MPLWFLLISKGLKDSSDLGVQASLPAWFWKLNHVSIPARFWL